VAYLAQRDDRRLRERCHHKGRSRDRCDHEWHGSFQHQASLHRTSLSRWANEDIKSKQQAQAVYERYRQAVRDGRVSRTEDRRDGPGTFDELADRYVELYVKPRGLRTAEDIEYPLKPLRRFFGPTEIVAIKTADVEDFIGDLRKPRVVNRQADRTLRPASINRRLALLRHLFNWAVAREYLERTPLRRGSATLIRLFREDNRRRRRVSEDEELRLLDAAPPLLRAMIVCALDTGMRRGEMLALTFGDVDWTKQVITLRGETTKSGRTRMLPIATLRLKAVLEWLRLDEANETKGEDVAVFSNAAGEPVRHFRKAWETTILRANGHRPEWEKGSNKPLTQESHAAFRAINLHRHDLRHEYASRLVERGVPLSQVRDLLGHASIVTTERYDNHTFAALQAAAGRLESGKSFTSASQTHAASDVARPDSRSASDSKVRQANNFKAGGPPGDRTRDTVIKSHVLYH
jgi:integrase